MFLFLFLFLFGIRCCIQESGVDATDGAARQRKMTTINSVDELGEMSEDELEELYTWIDTIPLSRPKRNMAQDFSDGVLVAEVIKHMAPHLVDIHSYFTTNSQQHKLQNWYHLDTKVFPKLGFHLSKDLLLQIVAAKPGIIEHVLSMLRTRLECMQCDSKKCDRAGAWLNERPEADENVVSETSTQRGGNVSGGDGGMVTPSAVKTVSIKFGSKLLTEDDTVPAILLEEKEQELLMKDETIQTLQAKIKWLEHLIHLKDLRIEDLQSRLESAT